MAYFGGTTTERPWPRFDVRAFAALLIVMCAGAAGTALLLGGDILKSTTSTGGNNAPAAQVAAVATEEVYVPVSTIWPGQKLNPAMFRKEQRAIHGFEGKVVQNEDELRGMYATSVITVDTLTLKEQLSPAAPTNIITARIPEGFRAVAIAVDASSGVEGWVRPGARVDVVWTMMHRGRQLVSTIVQNAQVLSAEHSAETTGGATTLLPNGKVVPSYVTLLASTRDAQRIQLARSSGLLSLTLRGDTDSTSSGSETITVDRLLRARDVDAVDEMQGTVTMDGKEYVIRGGAMIPKDEYKPKSSS